jgi:hypothetical protein
MDTFNLRKLNVVEVKEQYQVKISNRFAALKNLDDDVDDDYVYINRTREIIIIIYLFIPLSLRTERRASTVPRHPRLLFQFLGSIRHLVGLGGGIRTREISQRKYKPRPRRV